MPNGEKDVKLSRNLAARPSRPRVLRQSVAAARVAGATVRSERLEDLAWQVGVPADIVADIKRSIAHPNQLAYYQITPLRAQTVRNKFKQLQDAGVVLLIGTDSGIPMKFHRNSTWHITQAGASNVGNKIETAWISNHATTA